MSRQDSRCASAVTRRHFAATAAGLATAGLASSTFAQDASISQDVNQETSSDSLIKKGAVILFQGDSITDTGRTRDHIYIPNTQSSLGNGYAWLAASQLLVDRPDDKLTIYNRGISGNKVFQLAERWQTDALNLKPDVLSILIGVNDFWHTVRGGYDGTVEKYENEYRDLLKRTKEELPEVKLVICEPFALRCGAVNSEWFPRFGEYQKAAKKVAGEFNAVFVPFQSMFDRAVKLAPPERWAADGVHPTGDGAAIMAHTWRRCVDGKSI